MKTGISLTLIVLFLSICGATAQVFKKVATMSSEINETSGLEFLPNGKMITINDSGNDPVVYVINQKGEIEKRVQILNFNNTDWEDLAYDAKKDILYIADFGNNDNNRKNLKIGIISHFLDSINFSRSPSLLSFVYENQTQFPPALGQQHFDCESLINYGDSLYLFSKNRTDPYDGMVYEYVLPAKPGFYTAQLVDSTNLGGARVFNWITAADASEAKLYLLSSLELWEFEINGFPRISGQKNAIPLNNLSQKEAVCIVNADSLFISDEHVNAGPGLYLFTWSTVSNSPFELKSDLKAYSYNQKLYIETESEIGNIQVFTMNGTLIINESFTEPLNLKSLQLEINAKSTILYIQVELKNGIKYTKKVIHEI